MFISLLIATFLIALSVSGIIVLLFAKPVKRIMARIIPDEISAAWVRYLTFAIFVVGVGGGVRIHQMERYVTPQDKDIGVLVLTPERWVIEVYSTIIGTLGSIAWMLLVFFVFALLAYVLVRSFEMKHRDLPYHHAAGGSPGNPGEPRSI